MKQSLVITLVVLAVMNDLYNYKVRNQITITFIFLGILFNAYNGGLNELFSAVWGVVIPFAILLPLYKYKMLGAGDIKLFCSIGAFQGYYHILNNIAVSFIIGGVIAFLLMMKRNNFRNRIKYLGTYLYSCILCREILIYEPWESGRMDSKMHFTLPIALSTVFLIIK